MKNRALLGTRIFAGLLIGASIYKLSGFLSFAYYKFMFQYMPENLIYLRYVGSIVLRLFGIFLAIKLLAGKEKYRKIFVSLCIITILYTPIKHPYPVFRNIAIFAEKSQGINEYPHGTRFESGLPVFPQIIAAHKIKDPNFPVISMMFYIIIDILFSGCGIIYFTRPKVKVVIFC